MLNKVILIGRLVRDPELRYTPNGVAVARFTLAVDRSYNNRQGEKETDFIDIVVWQKLAETCGNHLTKGRLVCVEGELQIRSYEDRQGIRRKAAEIRANNVQFLDRKGSAEGGSDYDPQSQRSQSSNQGSESSFGGSVSDFDSDFGSEITFSEDDIPF